MLLEIVSTLYCWAIMPVAAVESALIMVGLLLLRRRAAADGLNRLPGGAVLCCDHLDVHVEPALVGDQADHRRDHVGVARLERALERGRLGRCGRRRGAGVDEARGALRPQRVRVAELD